MAFKQMENISHFLREAKDLGMVSSDLFQTADLYEASNMTQVLQCFAAFRRVVDKE